MKASRFPQARGSAKHLFQLEEEVRRPAADGNSAAQELVHESSKPRKMVVDLLRDEEMLRNCLRQEI
jgi:hypothetical protein